MLILLLVLLLIIILFCVKQEIKMDKNGEGDKSLGVAMLIIILLIMFVYLSCQLYDVGAKVIDSKYIDETITLYETENKNIENEVKFVADKYIDYEKDIYDKIADINTLVVAYPELKSDTIVKKQIDLYTKNNEQIKKLKLNKIEYSKYKFLLYFGN